MFKTACRWSSWRLHHLWGDETGGNVDTRNKPRTRINESGSRRGRGLAHTVTCRSNCYHSCRMETRHLKLTCRQRTSDTLELKTHSLIIQLLCNKLDGTLLQPSHTHISSRTSVLSRFQRRLRKGCPPRFLFYFNKRRTRILFSLIPLLFARSRVHKESLPPVHVTGAIWRVSWPSSQGIWTETLLIDAVSLLAQAWMTSEVCTSVWWKQAFDCEYLKLSTEAKWVGLTEDIG